MRDTRAASERHLLVCVPVMLGLLQAARGSVAREAAALEEQRAALASLLAQLEQREEALGQVCLTQ